MHTLLWPAIAFGLLLLFFMIYSLLDGFDLGIGLMLPFLRGKEEAAEILSLIAPFWDGNEVWLIMGAGFFFGAFPVAYTALLSAFYLPFMFIILAFILRAASIEFSYHSEGHPIGWYRLLAVASFFAAFAGLAALGFLWQGLPFSGPETVSGSLTDFLTPFPFLFALAGLCMVFWHGLAYILYRRSSQNYLKLAERSWPVVFGCVLLAGIYAAVVLPGFHGNPWALAGGSLTLLGLLLGRIRLRRIGAAFLLSLLSVTGLWLSTGALLFPNALIAFGRPDWNLTLTDVAASPSTLRPLTLGALVLAPVLLGLTIFVYRALHQSRTIQPHATKDIP